MKALTVTAIALLLALATVRCHAEHWGYGEKNGPSTWPGICLTGQKQSPINIETEKVKKTDLPPMQLNDYDQNATVHLENNGHTVEVSGFSSWSKPPSITIGSDVYNLAQFHFHWGPTNDVGSEHTVDSKSYPAELHLVHVKNGLTVDEARKTPGGLAVLGVFMQVGSDGPEPLAQLEGNLNGLGSTKLDIQNFRLVDVISGDKAAGAGYYRYEGSLTTPAPEVDCAEVVVWSVLSSLTMKITDKQLELLRSLADSEGQPLRANYRPVQGLSGRDVLYRPNA